MSKVRINDLARELEVKSKQILDTLESLGLSEGKTHSSSIEAGEAEKVRGVLERGVKAASSASRPKIDLSNMTRPGDVMKAILARKLEAERTAQSPQRPASSPAVVARPPATAPSGPNSSTSRPTVMVAPPRQESRRIVPRPRQASRFNSPLEALLENLSKQDSFDAFVSYNSSSDREAVETIARRLIRDGVRVWMDVISVRPGDGFVELTKDALSRASTMLAFIGPSGVGSFQQVEIAEAVRRRAQNRSIRLIPILLPGASAKNVPLDLRGLRWIHFSSLNDNSEIYLDLVRSIRSDDSRSSSQTAERALNDADLELIACVLFRIVARLRERPELLNSLDKETFWAQARKIAPQVSTLEDLRNLNENLSSIPGPGPLWSAWVRNTRVQDLVSLMRNTTSVEAILS